MKLLTFATFTIEEIIDTMQHSLNKLVDDFENIKLDSIDLQEIRKKFPLCQSLVDADLYHMVNLTEIYRFFDLEYDKLSLDPFVVGWVAFFAQNPVNCYLRCLYASWLIDGINVAANHQLAQRYLESIRSKFEYANYKLGYMYDCFMISDDDSTALMETALGLYRLAPNCIAAVKQLSISPWVNDRSHQYKKLQQLAQERQIIL